MLNLESISLQLSQKTLLNNVSMTVRKGQITGILGANGAGKSTLMKVISGEHLHYSGQVSLDEKDIKTICPIIKSMQMAYVTQHEEIYTDISVIDYVLLGALSYCKGNFSQKEYQKALSALSLLKADHFSQKKYQQLSGGERQRVQLARALLQLNQHDDSYQGYLLLDEYSAHMDVYYQRQTLQILSELVQQYDLAVLVIGHDLNIALGFYHQSLLLKNGQMLSFDQTEKVLTPAHIYTAFQVKADIIHRSENNQKIIVLT
ncbi:ABC transporter ATP-binding protein [Cysteiniphilum halobium]|uniref:ABC transporter ATP-binding protein n=1 Tax=Cysteiniphilum halobium TaxID=2219059 RepID=UPI003F85C5C7